MSTARPARLLLVGNPAPVHVGAHLREAGEQLGIELLFFDTEDAFRAPRPLQQLLWRLDRRPARLRAFEDAVVRACCTYRPDWLLSTGIAPLGLDALSTIGALGVHRCNFLTDDPWNPSHRSRWFQKALPAYDLIFSPRRSNLAQLRGRCQHARVLYLPFAYNPTIHFPAPDGASAAPQERSDLLFVGGGDADRLPWMVAAIEAGFDVALYGGYWQRYPRVRPFAKGMADPSNTRREVGRARVNLCLVRRANRDGHVMRSFELPAMGGCMLTEDTEEHRAIFGDEGQAVLYFSDIPEMLEKLRWLVAHDEERARLARNANQLITGGRHTYRDRLETMLAATEAHS